MDLTRLCGKQLLHRLFGTVHESREKGKKMPEDDGGRDEKPPERPPRSTWLSNTTENHGKVGRKLRVH